MTVTVISTEFSSETLQSWIDRDLEPASEFTRIKEVEYIDLPTGHWPQFTKPEELAQITLEGIQA